MKLHPRTRFCWAVGACAASLLACGETRYATAGAFAGAAGVLEVIEQAHDPPPGPPPCGRVPICLNSAGPICEKTASGCLLCTCDSVVFVDAVAQRSGLR